MEKLAIQVEHLSFSYPNGNPALTDISLILQSGEKAALVGANGAGKSTLLLHLNGIYRGQGEIKIAGLELKPKTLPQIRAKVGLVFQNPDDQLFSNSVYEDVAFGPLYQGLPGEVIRERVGAALAAVQMEGFAERSPYHLSSGEKKRIAIATVLAMEPQILVFDEPTAGLDPRARRELIALLRTLPQTLLVATHDLALVQDLLPRTILMEKGQIIADGFSSDILENQALLEAHGL
ncbi:MAG: ABC transporter ATP-binding protein [Anaerolineaceae bacterium]